jgi:cation transporter-like permease
MPRHSIDFFLGGVEDSAKNSLLPESAMVDWLFNILMLAAGSVTASFVEKDSPNFDVVQMMIAIMILVLFIFVLAYGPVWWMIRRSGSGKN